MKFLNIFIILGLISLLSCEKDKNEPEITDSGHYVLCLGVTSSDATAYYAVTTSDLMSGTISPLNNGLEQTGYRDFEQGGQTIFSIGGLGVTNVNAITMGADGSLHESGNFVFTQTLNVFTQADNSTMLGLELPAKSADADVFKFYKVDINTTAITQTVESPLAPLTEVEWPSITGMAIGNGFVYITYCQMNPTTYETAYTDTTYVAVYSYPDLSFQKIMKDTRTGPAGSWNAYNGIFSVENGDLYIMSNSAIANGYSQSTKNAAFLRIPKATTDFDNYYFDFESKSGGLKPAHIQYVGNGLVFAEVSTNSNQTIADRWGDKNLKCCIIDLNRQTITDITDIPVHDGDGGRRFTALVENGYVYYPVVTPNGIFIYQIDPISAKAIKGAEVQTTFVAGFFKLK
jgi:hypothetical protein